MAKALYGYVGIGSDVRLQGEVQRLRVRVRELESELATARAECDRLAASVRVGDDDLLQLSDLEHATL